MRFAWLVLTCVACHGGAATPPTDGTTVSDVLGDAAAGGPRRLTIHGREVLDGATSVELYGANLKDNLRGDDPDPSLGNCVTSCAANDPMCPQSSQDILSDAEADDLATTLSFDFVRLRISFEGINRDDCDPDGTNLSLDLRHKLDDAVARLSARHVWTLLEMRTSDAVANAPDLYMPDTADNIAYHKAWRYLAQHYANTDYIAGYGLLAEPSSDKAFTGTDVITKLTAFQLALMQTVDALDHRTPFFIGPAFNYDTMGYRWPDYATALAAFSGRMIYEVNVLMPKPWIKDGTDPGGGTPTYPMTPTYTGDQLDAALLAPQGNLAAPRDDEQLFAKHADADFAMLMNKPALAWYLEYAHGFAVAHDVPMIVDQFGATSQAAGTGQLVYEQDLIDAAEADGMGWCRWLYSTTSTSELVRDISHHDAVHAFYAARGAERPGP